MKKHLALTVLILIVLSIVVSCGEDPFFHHVTIKNDGETLGTETVRDGSKYTLPKEYKGIENLSGWTIDDDETVYDPGQEITVTKDITINAYTVQPYFDYEYLKGYGWEVTLLDEYRDTVTDVVIPASHEGEPVVSVGGFDNATNLVSVTFPSSVLVVDSFNNCTKLEKITFKEGAQVSAIMGFYNCTSLKSVVIPQSVTVIGDGCFYKCTSLESVTFEEGSLLTAIGKDGCFAYSKITSIAFPERLEEIGGGCCSYCSNLTTISIPNSVYEISDSAFSNINESAKITVDRKKGSIYNNEAVEWELGKDETLVEWSDKKTTCVVHYSTVYGQTEGEDFDSEIYDFGTEITIAECPSTWKMTGKVFKGWHTRSDYDPSHGRSITNGQAYSGPTITLYPIWEASSES